MKNMVIRKEDLQSVCNKILTAVDTSELSVLNETLEIKTVGRFLHIAVTNREYYVEVKIDIHEEADFHCTVNAKTFLKLISAITSDTITLTTTDKYLNIKANGNYKLPMIFNDDKLLELPIIKIDNPTAEFPISADILNSIALYNGKEVSRITNVANPVNKMYYVDDKGCITFYQGACVNQFSLPSDVRILLNDKLVRLFKLFKKGDVRFALGYDALTDNIIQTKVSFESDSIRIVAILSCDDTLINSVPVDAIRSRALNDYPYSIVVDKSEMLSAINRLLIFVSLSNSSGVCPFKFSNDSVVISSPDSTNTETIYYENDNTNIDNYSALLNLFDVKAILEVCTDSHITIKFGDSQAFVISRGAVHNVIPEAIQH